MAANRIVIIGNSAGGKSTLARRLHASCDGALTEVDSLVWQPGWKLTPVDDYNLRHGSLIAADSWIIEGLGRLDSIPVRLARATDIILIDLPLWIHFWLAAERQIKWSAGSVDHPPAGLGQMPATEALFRTIWEVDQDWMPEIRRWIAAEEQRGKRLFRLTSLPDVSAFGL